MTNDSMYEILMNLPAFRGITYNKVSQIVEKAKFHFLRFSPGNIIVDEGEECTFVKFIIKGVAKISIIDQAKRFSVEQTLTAPSMISPDFLFGRITRYPGRVVAQGSEDCGIVQISKNDYMQLLAGDEILILNMLNMLSMNSQQSLRGALAISTGSLERRLANWILALTQNDATDIAIHSERDNLYRIFNIDKEIFDGTIESMTRRGLVDSEPFTLRIKSRRELRDMLS